MGISSLLVRLFCFFGMAPIFVCLANSDPSKQDEIHPPRNEMSRSVVEEIGCPYVHEKQMLNRKLCLMPEYEAGEVPDSDDNIMVVFISFEDAEVLEVTESSNTIMLKLDQEIMWNEPRMRGNFFSRDGYFGGYIRVPHQSFRQIWHPETEIYTTNLQSSKSLYEKRIYEQIYAYPNDNSSTCDNQKLSGNGTTLEALKSWKVTIDCKFDFTNFPLDTQQCEFIQYGSESIDLRSCHPSDDHEFGPEEANGYRFTMIPIQETIQGDLIDGIVDNGTFYVGLNITLERIVTPYLFQYYFPCIAIVVVSTISFIIPVSAIPGRVALVVTQFLTLMNIFIHQMVINMYLYKYV